MGQSEVCAKAGPLVALKGFEESPGCVKVTGKEASETTQFAVLSVSPRVPTGVVAFPCDILGVSGTQLRPLKSRELRSK